MGSETRVPGWDDVVSWYGSETKFHDAEVIGIDLRRDPEPSVLKLHAWRFKNRVDSSGHYIIDSQAIVTITLSGIFQQSLDGWNHQNVLFNLDISKVDDGWLLEMEASFGVEGTIGAKDVRITLKPLTST